MQQPPTQQQNQSSSGTGSELRSDAKQIGSTAASRIYSEVDARKSTAATQAKSVSNAIESAAGQLDEGAPDWLRSAFQQGADQIQRFAETLERKDSRQIIDDVQGFARERPGVFLGACAAAGFATARLFRAGGEQQGSQQFTSQSGNGSKTPGGDRQDFGRSESVGRRFDEGQPFVASGGSEQGRSATDNDPLILGSNDQSDSPANKQGEYL